VRGSIPSLDGSFAVENLTEQVAEQANQRCNAQRLMTHPGVGPVTALATEIKKNSGPGRDFFP